MNINKSNLKKFVKENYEKLKKAKKSTALYVIPGVNPEFGLSKEPGTLHLGLLKDLYNGAEVKHQGSGVDEEKPTGHVTSSETATGKSKKEKSENFETVQRGFTNDGSFLFAVRYDNFKLSWIPFIQAAFATIFAAQPWVYDELDSDYQELISEEEFNNLVNYSLNK